MWIRTAMIALLLVVPGIARAQSWKCEDYAPPVVKHVVPEIADPEQLDRALRYAEMAQSHTLAGRACYYSDFFEGRKTASGERFRHKRFTAAHRTLPFGTWLEVKSVETGKSIRLKVNDRGPYSGGFVLDLTRAAARALGVDVARDRRVTMRIVALPGEEVPEEETPTDAVAAAAGASIAAIGPSASVKP
ncbi:MAG: septal ring lytic transglycosylase RlpA family protein [Thermoanaerobaculia bacterium]